MAGVWRSNLRAAKHFTDNDNLVSQISLAMDWWFVRDFTNPACLDSGGTDVCPCDPDDITMWNTNWFSNVACH